MVPLRILNKRRLWLLSVFLLQGLFCAAQPDWVKHAPVDAAYYIGVASAEKTDAAYMDLARDRALSRLASNIAVTVYAESSAALKEENGQVSESFESRMESFAMQQIAEYEVYQKWENRKEYWVYYRLSKDAYKALMERKKAVAQKEAMQYYKLSHAAQKSGDYLAGLSNMAKAAQSIGPFRGMGIPFLQDPDQFLDVLVFTELDALLAGIQISCTAYQLHASLCKVHTLSPYIHVKYLNAQGGLSPLVNLPLKLVYDTAFLATPYAQPTNEEGRSSLHMTEAYAAGQTQLQFLPDIEKLAGMQTEQTGLGTFATTSLPSATLNLQLNPIRVKLASNSNRFDALAGDMLRSKLSEELTKYGWVLDNHPDVDYTLQLTVNAQNGSEVQGMFTAFSSGSIALVDQATQQELKHAALKQVNGGGLNFEQAADKAMMKLSEQLTTVIESMVSDLKQTN